MTTIIKHRKAKVPGPENQLIFDYDTWIKILYSPGLAIEKKVNHLIILSTFLVTIMTNAQVINPPIWTYDFSKEQVKVGDEVDLIFNVIIDKNWYLFSSDFDPDLGPMVTKFIYEEHPSYQLVGKIIPLHPKKKYDNLWGGEFTYFTKTAQFRQKIKVLQLDLLVKGFYEYQLCSDVDGLCIPFNDEFVFNNMDIQVIEQVPPTVKQ